MPKKKIPYSKLYKNGRPGIPIMYYYLDNLRFNNTANNNNNNERNSSSHDVHLTHSLDNSYDSPA